MRNALDLIATEEARDGFYPTPRAVADKLLEGLDWSYFVSVLEPSAGKGNLVEAILRHHDTNGYRSGKIEIDCIEIDPHIRSVLQYEYCGPRNEEEGKRYHELERRRHWDYYKKTYSGISPSEEAEYQALKARKEWADKGTVRIVHDDFTTFESRKQYGLIVMNPPFKDGDAHLLKAIEMQRRGGGEIRCILNAETLRNPYTNRRKVLMQTLLDLEADVQFLDGAFSKAERETDVPVALIRVKVPEIKRESAIYEGLRKAAEMKEPTPDDVTDLTVADFISRIVTQFNVEVEAGLKLIEEYLAMRPYIMRNMDRNAKYNSPTLAVVIAGSNGRLGTDEYPSVNKFLTATRRKYWEALFTNKEFTAQLTKNLREKYEAMVDQMQDFDFTLFNIQRIMVEMNAEMCQGVQDTIVALFDKLTQEYSYYPECSKNIHYYNGWKTNKAHKIGGKVILPIHGVFADYSWSKETFSVRNAEAIISDIEKVFEYLDGNATAPVDLHGVLKTACEAGRTKNIQCKFFSVTLYKKGTMHIKFHNQRLVDRFNIYCCGKKGWLPPSYGRTKYDGMTDREKAVVDGFHGDGTQGAGQAAYEKVLSQASYFLSEPTQQVPALMAPGT